MRKKKIRHIYLAPDTIHIFTDGASSPRRTGQKGPGGWGAVMIYKDKYKEIYGGSTNTTNNEMELMGIYQGLKALKLTHIPVIIYSDSMYSINALSEWWRGWKARGWITASGTPVKNVELIKDIIDLIHPLVSFRWVKGHSGLCHNERADRLASKGKKEHGKRKERAAYNDQLHSQRCG